MPDAKPAKELSPQKRLDILHKKIIWDELNHKKFRIRRSVVSRTDTSAIVGVYVEPLKFYHHVLFFLGTCVSLGLGLLVWGGFIYLHRPEAVNSVRRIQYKVLPNGEVVTQDLPPVNRLQLAEERGA